VCIQAYSSTGHNLLSLFTSGLTNSVNLYFYFKFQDKPEIVLLGKLLKNIIVLIIEYK